MVLRLFGPGIGAWHSQMKIIIANNDSNTAHFQFSPAICPPQCLGSASLNPHCWGGTEGAGKGKKQIHPPTAAASRMLLLYYSGVRPSNPPTRILVSFGKLLE